MRIALAIRHVGPTFIPLALMYLKASLVGRGCCRPEDVTLVEFPPEATAAAMARDLLDRRADVIGFSCYLWNVKATLEGARLIKAGAPQTRIVLGGPEVGPVAADVLRRHPYVDAIVCSEGEVPLADIVRAWQAAETLEGVAGICFRNGQDVVESGAALIVKDLGEYPSPHLEHYLDYKGRVVCLETQRGCVFRCNFCFYNKDYSIRNRRFALERVKAELLIALEQEVEEIYLMDPVFNLNAARTKEICRFIADHNTRRVPIHTEIWAEFVDDEMASLMHDAGINFLEVGLQTTNETALATTERRLRLERFNEGLAHLRRYNLNYELQLIYGLPGETRSTFRDSLNFAMSLDPPHLQVFRLMVLPGTELWRKAASLSLTFDPEPPYHVRSHTTMTEDDVDYGHRLLKSANLLQASRTVRLLAREPRLTFSELCEEWMAWRPGAATDTADSQILKAFVEHVCDKQQIAPDFYQQFGAFEFA